MSRASRWELRYKSRVLALVRRVVQRGILVPAAHLMCRVETYGDELVEDLDGAFIVASNHSSHLDTPLIYGGLPTRTSDYLAVGAAADTFFMHWWTALPLILSFNAYPIDRPDKKHHGDHRGRAAELLRAGIPELVFPEGTRSRTGALGVFKPGVARLCVTQKVPFVPVAIVGAYSAWPATRKVPRLIGRPRVIVVFGNPLWPRAGELPSAFSERMRRRIIELHDDAARQAGRKTFTELANARRVRHPR